MLCLTVAAAAALTIASSAQQDIRVLDLPDNVHAELVAARVSTRRGQNLEVKLQTRDTESVTLQAPFPSHSFTTHEKTLMEVIRASVRPGDERYEWQPATRELVLSVPADPAARSQLSHWYVVSMNEREGGAAVTQCQREVEELHQFFQDWFTGSVPPTDEAFSRFESVMAAEFTMVTPDGVELDRAALVPGLRAAYDKDEPGVRIWVKNVRSRELAPGIWLVHYEEWQNRDGADGGRMSTAVLRARDGLPQGLEWVRVHETRLP